MRLLRQRRQPLQLAGPDHLVADQHVRHAAVHHRLGLADLLAAHPDGPQGHLPPGDYGALVRFGVRAQSHRRARYGTGQVLQIAFKGIEVDQQGRGVDLFVSAIPISAGGRVVMVLLLRGRVVPRPLRGRMSDYRAQRDPLL